MRAEERARDLLMAHGFTMRECVNSDVPAWVEEVAAVIRAAENDALERSAEAVERDIGDCANPLSECMTCRNLRLLGERIRSLKTGGSR